MFQDNSLLRSILVAIVLGIIIGNSIEQAHDKRCDQGDEKALKYNNPIGGVRTFTFLLILSTLSGYLSIYEAWFGQIVLLILGLFVLLSHALTFLKLEFFGITSEIVMLIVIVLGFGFGADHINLASTIAIAIIISFLISVKEQIREISHIIPDRDFINILKYGLIAFIVRPLLPNTDWMLGSIGIIEPFLASIDSSIGSSLSNVTLFNPYVVWELVVIISCLRLLGQLGQYFFSPTKTYLLNALFGGLVSSTASTLAFANESKGESNSHTIKTLVAATIVANAASYIRLILLVFPLSAVFFGEVSLILLALTISMILWATMISKKNYRGAHAVVKKMIKKHSNGYDGKKDEHIDQNPIGEGENDNHKIEFSIKPTLKFVAVYIFIKILYQLLIAFNLTQFLIIGSFIGGFTGTTSVMMNIAEIAESVIPLERAVFIAMVLIGSNLLAKSIYSFMIGSKSFAIGVTVGLLSCFSVALLVMWFI